MITKHLIFAAILTITLSSAALACDQGFEAFKPTVYAKVRRDCAKCHDGSRTAAPPFATGDAVSSYNQLLSYMSFSKIEESLLVFRAGNGHCGLSNCQEASGKEMAALAQSWFDGGEKVCERNGRLFSEEIDLPADLPTQDAGLRTLSIDLGSLKPELKGIKFEIEAQNYLGKSAVTKGAYRFRSPRFHGGKGSIYAKNVKILLNGKYDVIYNQYSTIDQTFPFLNMNNQALGATPILSASTILVLKDGLPNQKVSVSFTEIALRNDERACINSIAFAEKVMPVLKSNNCASCHNGSGKSTSETIFDCTSSVANLCEQASSLINQKFLMVSPLILVPSQGLYNHPQLSDDDRYAYVAAIKGWLNR